MSWGIHRDNCKCDECAREAGIERRHVYGCMCTGCQAPLPSKPEEPMHQLIQAVKVLRVEPGDIVVLKVHQRITAQHMDHLTLELKKILPDGQPSMVLDERADIEIVRPTANEGAPTWDG